MADGVKISDLNITNSINGADIFAVVQNGETKRIQYSYLEEIQTGNITPTDNEKIWLKCGKNLFNKDKTKNGYVDDNGNYVSDSITTWISDYIPVMSSTTYTASSSVSSDIRMIFYNSNKQFISRIVQQNTTSLTQQTPIGTAYMRVSGATNPSNLSTFQLEQNSSATTYEDYVNKEISVKNGNGNFENFYDENSKNFIDENIYSIEEKKIGMWVDEKPIYKKTIKISNTALSNGDNYIPHNIANLSQCIKAELVKVGSHIFPYANSSGSTISMTIIAYVDNTNITIRAINDSWGSGNIWYATVYYTKTTD